MASFLSVLLPAVHPVLWRKYRGALQTYSETLDRGLNVGHSSGETKKFGILQLLVQHPDLVLLDEPESGVDPENREILGKAIKGPTTKTSPATVRQIGLLVSPTGYHRQLYRNRS